jgi:hypothetical protein
MVKLHFPSNPFPHIPENTIFTAILKIAKKKCTNERTPTT